VSPVRDYLREVAAIRASGGGTDEQSLYHPLQTLLNTVGTALRPKVFCVAQLADTGAGRPDFGLYVGSQLSADHDGAPLPGAVPERGVIEAKPPADDVRLWADSRQVTAYWERYRLVLVTNYREFLIVGADQFGRRVHFERFVLADRADAFWRLAAHPAGADPTLAQRFEEFLKRALLHAAQLHQPRDVAWFLASYARETLLRLEAAGATRPDGTDRLVFVRTALEDALGIAFVGEEGQHFFRSTLVQTLFYGVFSAWVLWCRTDPDRTKRKGFDARGAAWTMRLPVLRELFWQISAPGALGPLRLHEPLDWAAAMLRRVDDRAFFARFREDRAVQYFYEPFLEAFDPDLRRQLGVWYTPPEVVDYMVERVDRALRDELGLADGLADDGVVVLDPCCGTGSYLVAVLRRIARTLRERSGDDALAGLGVKRAATDRVHGFEIMPAPFVVAHMQVAMALEDLGGPLSDEKNEYASIRLTNALTGWDAEAGPGPALPLPDLQCERDWAREVKVKDPVLVVLGNPPYNGYAGVSGTEEERALTDAYRRTRRVRRPEGQGLNDLYVRFYRMAERRIAERTGRGVVCFISNYSWLDGLSYTGMRERFLEAFDRIWIDCLNGDKYKTGKLTPEGKPDPSIFSTEFNREGIQVGTAIGLLVRREAHDDAVPAEVRFRSIWGRGKWEELERTKDGDGVAGYDVLSPPEPLGLPLLPIGGATDSFSWPQIVDLMPSSFPGVKTSRDQFLVDIDRERLFARVKDYFDIDKPYHDLIMKYSTVSQSTKRYDADRVRADLLKREFLCARVAKYHYRPFDVRWVLWEGTTKLLDERRTDYVHNIFSDNIWLSAGQRNRKDVFYQPQVTRQIADHHIVESNVSMFPLYIDENPADLDYGPRAIRPNVSRNAAEYCIAKGAEPADLFFHIVAVLHAASYVTDNMAALRQDWPRIPLPSTRERLVESAALGRRVAALLDPEAAVDGVTRGTVRTELKPLGVLRRSGSGPIDLRVNAGWGRAGQNGVTMPGRGDARRRPYTDEERDALLAGTAALGLAPAQAYACLGDDCFDVHLNAETRWACVPARVWAYTIGGYQVLKKWLSYREHPLLGRPLHDTEAAYVRDVIRRLAALLLLEPALDANYRTVAADPYPWPPR